MNYLRTAAEMFKAMPDMVRYVPKQNFKNCIVSFEKIAPNRIDKIVTRKDGTTIAGHFGIELNQCPFKAPEKFLGGVTLNTARGRIAYSYGAQNYDKVVQLDTYLGDHLTRLGHKNNPKCFTDTFYHRDLKRYGQGDYSSEYQTLMNFIKEG